MNKKGVDSRVYLWTFYLALTIFLFWALFTYINDVAEGEDFNKDYMARDLALLMNTLYASPGNIVIEYPLKKEFYTINIGKIGEEYKVKVNTIERGVPVEYPYAEDSFGEIDLEKNFGKSDSINSIFFKKGEELFIEEIEPILMKPTPTELDIIEEKKEDFIWPIEGDMIVTSCLGERKGYSKHKGIDVRARYKEVRAVADGKIIGVPFEDTSCHTIRIEHEEGIETRYIHLKSSKVDVNDDVKKGDIIGISGSYGCDGTEVDPHLHLAVLINDKFVDPLTFFDISELKFTKDSNCYYYSDKYAYKKIIEENVIKEEVA